MTTANVDLEPGLRAIAVVTVIQTDVLDVGGAYELVQCCAPEHTHAGLRHLVIAAVAGRVRETVSGPAGELLALTPVVETILGVVAAVLAIAAIIRPRRNETARRIRAGRLPKLSRNRSSRGSPDLLAGPV